MTTPQSLAGLNVVVTRPREQAVQLMQRIAALGGNAILLPLLEISPAGDQEKLHAQLERIARFDLLIFISPNAVSYGMAAMPSPSPQPSDETTSHSTRLANNASQVADYPARGEGANDRLRVFHANTRIAAVGQGSAQALRELGVADVIVPAERFDSEGLLALPELQEVAGKRLAILRGDGGRELLGDSLKARGATVEYVTCYRRGKPPFDADALWAARPDAITVTSSEALGHLREMFPESDRDRLADIPLFVPHPRIAALARQQGWRRVHQTASGDDGLLSGLVAWAEQKGPR